MTFNCVENEGTGTFIVLKDVDVNCKFDVRTLCYSMFLVFKQCTQILIDYGCLKLIHFVSGKAVE